MTVIYSINRFTILLLMCICSVNSAFTQNLRQEYYACALEAFDQKHYINAIHYYDLIVDTFPGDSMAYFDRAMTKELLKDYSGAIDDYTQQIRIDSTNVDSYFLRGIANYKAGNYQATIIDCTKTLSIENDNYDALYYRALANFKLNHLKSALQDLDTAIFHNPTANLNYYYYRAEILFQFNELKKSCEDYNTYKQMGGTEKFTFHCAQK